MIRTRGPRLQPLHGPLLGSVILGVLWASWHLPLFWSGVWTPPTIPNIAMFIAMITALTVVMTLVFNNANGSLLITIKKAIEAAGLSFILGMHTPDIPYVVSQWRHEHPDQPMPDGLVLTQPWPAGPADKRRDQVIYYQYKADRARRTLHGIDEQVAKAERAVAGKIPGQTQPVHQARRRRQVGQPHPGGQSARVGRDGGADPAASDGPA